MNKPSHEIVYGAAPHPVINYNAATEEVTIDGFRFSREFFSHITASPCGITFRIIERNDGLITITQDRDPLAVAAPDMLTALQSAESTLENLQRGALPAIPFPRLVKTIRAAISKATGKAA